MKKLILTVILVAMLGCSAIDKAKDKIVNEVKGYNLAVTNTTEGYVYRENGKFYFKADVNSNPKEIDMMDVGEYTMKTIID